MVWPPASALIKKADLLYLYGRAIAGYDYDG
jgi:hypothetical protein